MMRQLRYTTVCTAGLSLLTAIGLSGCSAHTTTGAHSDDSAQLVGTQCAVYRAQHPVGPGSLDGMRKDPVAVAAAHNPMLTTFSSALSAKLNPAVNLVDTVDRGQYTVFAPTDDAFRKLAQSTMDSLKTDAPKLRSLLTYHVLTDRIGPAKIDGTRATLQGTTVDVTGTGNEIKVNDASLVCGGINTANATVYMIDTVLMPPGQPAGH